MYYRGAMFWTFIVVVELQTFQFMMSQMKRERESKFCYATVSILTFRSGMKSLQFYLFYLILDHE